MEKEEQNRREGEKVDEGENEVTEEIEKDERHEIDQKKMDDSKPPKAVEGEQSGTEKQR